MNPEAGIIQGPFRAAVERIARAHLCLPADEVIRRAQGEQPRADGEVVASPPALPERPQVRTETPMELQFDA